jgi:hypothetical protein
MSTANYALEKVKSIRADNVRSYEAGECAVVERQTLAEVDRMQEMNLSLLDAKRPTKDLVKDIPGYQVPGIDDPHVKKLAAGQER